MPDPIILIPLDAIEEKALARDRTAIDPLALRELKNSILTSGLRIPIEVYESETPRNGRTWGLISGLRRLTAFRELHELAEDKTRFATIPAFVRSPETVAEAFFAMVEENAIRAEISPWEQALVALTTRNGGLYPTLDAAIDGLYANLNREKRRRLRLVAELVDELEGVLTNPETWPQQRLLRLAAACNRGFGDVIRHALNESKLRDAGNQWRILQSILAEAENPAIPAPHVAPDGRTRPRRTYQAPLHYLRIRRERTPEGWCLHFTGNDAYGMLIDTIFDHIEHMLSPG